MEYSIDSICGEIVNVIRKDNSTGFNNLWLVIKNHDYNYLIDNDAIIHLVEDTHKLLFDDYFKNDISAKKISICLKNINSEQVVIDNNTYGQINSVQQINPDHSNSDKFYNYDKLVPVCPREDATHKYVEVPVSYKHPEWGTFNLYYELNSDFDAHKPTIMMPTDAQRESSQVGMADKYKKIFDTSFNIVTYEYRGMFCSKIDEFQNRNLNWQRAYESLHSDNAIEDIERIRQDLLGDEKMYLLGGSGIASIGLKYLSKYHQKVEKAYLLGFFKDAVGGSNSAIVYFNKFLKEHNMESSYSQIVENNIVPLDQFLFLVQRLLYSDESRAIELIKQISNGDLTLYNDSTKEVGTVDYFIRSVQKYFPHIVVFMHETNVITSENGKPDINYPFLKVAEPLHRLEDQGLIPSEYFDIFNLDKVSTETMLIAGTLDQVAPLNEMEKIHNLLPNSKLAIFKAYHCLQVIPEAKKVRNEFLEVFFNYGSESEEFSNYLKTEAPRGKFLELRK